MKSDVSLGEHQFKTLLTVGECSRRAGVTRQAVTKWIQAGKVRAIQQVGSGLWCVPLEDLERLIAARKPEE